MQKISLRLVHRVSMFSMLLFVVCFAWFYINPVEQIWHLQFFRVMFIGFTDMNLIGFISGLVQSYVWGYIFVGLWQLAQRFSKR